MNQSNLTLFSMFQHNYFVFSFCASLDFCSKAMLLCRVVLGRVYQSGSVTTLRKPPNGYDSIGTSAQVVGSGAASIYAVFDNAQAIPEYIVHLA